MQVFHGDTYMDRDSARTYRLLIGMCVASLAASFASLAIATTVLLKPIKLPRDIVADSVAVTNIAAKHVSTDLLLSDALTFGTGGLHGTTTSGAFFSVTNNDCPLVMISGRTQAGALASWVSLSPGSGPPLIAQNSTTVAGLRMDGSTFSAAP